MNPERYMVTAVPIGGGERVTGCPVKYGETWQIWVEREDGTWNYVIDPATIEPVKLPVTRKYGEYLCPSCSARSCAVARDYATNELVGTTPFCGNCGQALDWGERRDET